ncbi:MAG TPA: sugar ABC transporter ATP-binding protein [Fimbriimonadaceae bacterium]|nr:sugar ABC transporter ATP-binding protein [Fimbriimonadaceae bacterium]
MAPVLEATGIVKRFPGLIALDQVSLSLTGGEVHALMGENGAGKSTLIKAVTGVTSPDAGEIRVEGKPFQPRAPHDAMARGIRTVHQELNLVPNLPVAENLALGRLPAGPFGIRWHEVRTRAEAALARIGVTIPVSRTVGALSIAEQQLVAIARAVDRWAGEPLRVLILDEPTSSLDRAEVVRLFDVVRRLRNEGVAILFVSHFLDQVYEISDRITVLRNGRLVATGTVAEIPHLELVQQMTGRSIDLESRSGARSRAILGESTTLLEATSLGKRRSVSDVTLTIRAGDVVGFAGLLGSGRTEAIRLLYGLDRADSGRLTGRGPGIRGSLRAGFGLCPEDRKRQGIFPQLSLRENILIALQAQRGWWRPLTKGKQRGLVDDAIARLRIAATDAEQAIGTLSGGNQQKAILARWLAAEPKLLLLDEPTRGIDIGSKADLMGEVERLRSSGMAFVFVSSEMPEVVAASTQVAVFRDRRMVSVFAGASVDEPTLLAAIAEGAPSP